MEDVVRGMPPGAREGNGAMNPVTEDVLSAGALISFTLMVAMWARLIEVVQLG